MNHEDDPAPTQGALDRDEDLRTLLRRSDPAADLPDIDPAWIAWKVRQTTAGTTRSVARPAPSRTRRRRFGFAGAGLGTVAAGIAAVAIGTSGTAVTALTLPPATMGGPAAMCAQITPQTLAQRQTAFEARVGAIEDGQVTLEVTRRFKGEVQDEVQVPQPAADLSAEFSPGRFDLGADYLISTDDGGQVSVCGQSGPASPELRSLYEQAYG